MKTTKRSATKRITTEPKRFELTVKMPGLEAALVGMVQAAIAHAAAERAAPSAGDDERLALAQASQALDEDRQRLAWEEHRFRVREWEARQKLLEAGKSAY